jgi:PAS domain S-box-containing protein
MKLAAEVTETENLFETLANKSPVGLYIVQNGKFCYTNSTFQTSTGYREDELLGRNSLELTVPEDGKRVRENAIKMLKGELTLPYQFRVTKKDGSIRWIMESVVSIQYRGRRATLGNFIDVTEREQVEEKVQHLNLVLQAIRNINQLIARGTDRDDLLKGACDTFVKTRGYYSAWIALLDESGKLVTAAEAGLGKSFMQVMERLKRGELTHCGCKVMEKPGVLVMKDVSSECEDCPVAEEDTGRGAMSVRLEYGGKVYGLMTVSIPPGRAAEKEEHDLLEEIAGDIAFALYSIGQEQERKRVEEMLQSERNKLQSLVDAMEDTVTIQDTEYNIIYQNEPSRIASGGDHRGEKCYRTYEGRETVCDGCPVEKAFKDGKSHTSERRTVISGKVAFWENTANPIRDAKGKIVSCLELTRDITERKKQEQALADEATRRRLLIDQSLDGIVVLDEDARVCEANPRFAEMLGYTLDEVHKLHTWDWDKNFPPEQLLEMGRNVDEKGLHLETKHTRKDGSAIDVDISINGTICGGQKLIFCVCRDITERKQAEEALQSERNKLQSLVDAMEDGLTIQDRDYNIIYEGRLQRTIFGDHVGEKCYRVYEGREKICEGCPVEKAFKDGKSHTAERSTILPSGEVAFWENTANPIKGATGEIVSCLEIGRDITERKKQEQALADEATRRRLLVDKSLDGIVVLDEDAKVVEANHRFAEMLGYTLEEAYKLHTWDWDKNFSPEQLLEMGQNVDEKGLHLETKHTRKDGSVIDVDISISKITYRGQRLIFCICRDITERKQAEETLQAEKNKLQSLIDAMEDGLTIQDRDYNIIYQNDMLKGILGDHVGEKCYRAYAHKNKVCNNCPVAKAFRDGKSHTVEKEVTLPSGKVVFWEPTANPIRDAKGKIVSCLEVIRDITEHKKQEQALADELTQRRLLVDQSLDGIVVLDVDAKVVEANQRFADMLGYTLEEVQELHTWDWDKQFPPEKLLEMGRGIDEKGLHLETRHTRKDGSVIDVDISISAAMLGGQKLIFCVCRDITERNRAEEALKDSEESYKELADSITEVFFAMDEHLRYTYWNKASEILTGVRAEDALGKSLSEVFRDSPGLRRAEEVYRAVLKTQKSQTFVNDFDIDGRHYIFEIGAYPSRGGISVFVRDITERKRAEEALLQSEENYRALFDSAVIGTIVIDAETMKVMIANQAAAEMLGFSSAKEVTGVNPLDSVPTEDRERVRELLVNEFFEQDLRRTHELRMITKDGRQIWISANGARIMHEGRLAGLASFTDITERKSMEEAINLQRAYFQQLFDNSPDAILMTDTNSKVIQANKGSEVLFGYSNEEVKGRSLIELIIPELDVQEASDSFQRILGGEVIRKESVRRRKDGSLVDVSILAYPIRFNDKFIGLYGVYSDITERKRAEEAIKHAAEEWRNTFDSITDAISIHDRDFRILRANKAFSDIFHKKPSKIIGRHCYELHKGEKPISGCPHKQTLATKQPAVAEFYESHLRKYLHESTSPIFDEKGEVVGTVHITRDITEQKQQNERLMMADRLASIGELAAGTAHELNNPLTSVIGFSQLLMEKDIPDDAREDIELIYNEAQRAANVTESLLTFGRKHAPMKQPNQINNIIEDVLKLRDYAHKSNSIEVERHLASDLPEILVDYFQMQQVFLNIIINAEYFMTEARKRGTLTITTKKQNSNVRISIADDGPGISRENLSWIFNPFFTTKEAGKGTGLGLSICHGIVSEHGGQIYARSQPGKGATIIVELPINNL